MSPTILSFFCDDTSPFTSPPGAFKTFLDFITNEGVRGESSVILGFDWQERGRLLSEPSTPVEEEYIEQLQRASACGSDAHFELMTHAGIYDFERRVIPQPDRHEGVWLYEPEVTVAEYEGYFGSISAEGEKIGVRFTGLTQPGCGCPVCVRRHQELGTGDQSQPNPNVFHALLDLARRGKFRGRSVPCFFGGCLDDGTAELKAHTNGYSVYNLHPNLHDRFGSWRNLPEDVNADYYISQDGLSGRLAELVRAGAPYALFYCHWQGLNPGNGVGWTAFTQVVQRIQRYFRDDVEWLRPSEYSDRLAGEMHL